MNPSYAWDAIASHIATRLTEESGVNVEIAELVAPPKPDLGDVAFGCFKIAKAQGKNPAEIAKVLAEKIGKGDHTIEQATAAGPYVNIALKASDLIHRIVNDVERLGDQFGTIDEGKQAEMMLEYAQPNTHKEIHVGHLRNLVLGSALVNVLRKANWKVIPASYHGDVGAHVAKCLWLFVREGARHLKQPKPKKGAETMPPDAWISHVLHELDVKTADALLDQIDRKSRTGAYLGRLYSESTKLLEENPEWKEEVSFVQQQLEGQQSGWMKVWQETRRWSLSEMDTLFQEIGVQIQRRYLESEVVDEGQRIVDELIAKGVAHESQGAIVVDLEDQKLGVFLVRKSDGTSLYATKDLALAQLKMREFPKITRSLMLVDNRQSLYFQQLFATLKLMGLTIPFEFVGYEFVTLKTGAMSSREGNIVTLQSFSNDVLAFAKKETAARHPDWPEGRVEHTAWCLAMGGVKYGMLKQDSDKLFTFDLEQALSFDGDTGPYVQYAVTRLGSILKKAGWDGRAADGVVESREPAEKKLALHLASYPAVCRRAAQELRPALIAQWCLTMSHRITEFYHEVKVLDAAPEIRDARLRLVAATQKVLISALAVLGIPVPDEM